MIARFLVILALILSPLAAPAQGVARIDIGGEVSLPRAGFAFGGGVWRVPKVMRLAEPALADLGEGGTWRAALAWEVLAPARSLAEVEALLRAYPLNAFLTDRAQQGGTVIVTLDAMPRYLARETSDKRLGDGPLWARSALADEAGWADLTAAVVRHFRSLGIDAIYEVWNEPDHAFRGGIDDYMALYRATVAGARRVDGSARIAGPALSDWTAATDGGERWVAAFLTRAAAMGLPVDVLTYHSFNRVPAAHHARVADEAARLLAQAGYGRRPLICSEWNIAAEPPYPEGDLNGNHAGAAHIGATLIAMARAGVGRQVFQMMVDPGTDGYSGGVLTAAGTPRAAFHAFAFAAEAARGTALDTRSSNGAVQALAFRRGGRTTVLVAVFPPTDLMLIRDAMEPLALADPAGFAALTAIPADRMRRHFLQAGRAPDLPPGPAAALAEGRARFEAARAETEGWRQGGSMILALPRPARLIGHRLIDQATGPAPRQILREDRATNRLLRDLLTRTGADLRGLLPRGDAAAIRAYGDALAARLDGRAELTKAGPEVAAIDAAWIGPALERLAALRFAQAAALNQPVADVIASGFTLNTRAPALHLLTFEEAP